MRKKLWKNYFYWKWFHYDRDTEFLVLSWGVCTSIQSLIDSFLWNFLSFKKFAAKSILRISTKENPPMTEFINKPHEKLTRGILRFNFLSPQVVNSDCCLTTFNSVPIKRKLKWRSSLNLWYAKKTFW